jgi:hypothetical protein
MKLGGMATLLLPYPEGRQAFYGEREPGRHARFCGKVLRSLV